MPSHLLSFCFDFAWSEKVLSYTKATVCYLSYSTLNAMPASIFESLVREYLECEGYLVYSNLDLPDNKGEIDIVAYSPSKGSIVGEVKGGNLNRTTVRDFARYVYNKKDSVAEYVKHLYNIDEFKLVLFCWNMYSKDEYLTEIAKNEGINEVVSFPRIVKDLLSKVRAQIDENNSYKSNVNRPNSSMIRIIYDALRYGNKYLAINDFTE